MKKILNKIIHFLGRKNYSIDAKISSYNMLIILLEKLIQLFRGFFLKIFLKKSNGFVFIGKRVIIKHKNLVIFGKTIFLGDDVEINALSHNGVVLGNNVSIHRSTIIECTGGIRSIGQGIKIGNNVGISQNCFIQVRGDITIGNNVILGPYVKIFSENHNFGDISKNITDQGETRKGVIIRDGVWIGSGSIILDGVEVGENAIVAAGSVVTNNIEKNSIVAGIPAKIIKYR